MKVSALRLGAGREAVRIDVRVRQFTNIWLRLITRTDYTAAALCRVVGWVASSGSADPALLLVVWALKREVRAIRGCLGAYRR